MEFRKTYIRVIAEFSAVGQAIVPLVVTLYDGRCMPIDKVIEIRKVANLKVGGLEFVIYAK